MDLREAEGELPALLLLVSLRTHSLITAGVCAVNRRGERLLTDLFSATITLPRQWLVCLQGFVMPADQIQFIHGKVAIVTVGLALTNIYFHLPAVRLSACWILKFMYCCYKQINCFSVCYFDGHNHYY